MRIFILLILVAVFTSCSDGPEFCELSMGADTSTAVMTPETVYLLAQPRTGQEFSVPLPVTLTSIEILLTHANDVGDLTLHIYKDGGQPEVSTNLDTITLVAPPAVDGYVKFVLNAPLALLPGVPYYFSLDGSPAPVSVKVYKVANKLQSGNFWRFTGAWTAYPGTQVVYKLNTTVDGCVPR
jgi:hypothetical protein